MKIETLNEIKKAINGNRKTLVIEESEFVTPYEKLYFSPKRKYAIVNGGYYRWFIVDLFRNLESVICVETKEQALVWVAEYEQKQLENDFENDKDVLNANKINEDFYRTFGRDEYYKRYENKKNR